MFVMFTDCVESCVSLRRWFYDNKTETWSTFPCTFLLAKYGGASQQQQKAAIGHEQSDSQVAVEMAGKKIKILMRNGHVLMLSHFGITTTTTR